jgi:hypothetical protein
MDLLPSELTVLRVVLPPLVTAYAIFVATVLAAVRRPVPRPRRGERPVPVREVLTTAVGGYLAFLAIVLVFHVWIAGDAGALRSAARGGAFLSAMAVGVAAVWSAVAGRRRRWR